MPKVKQVFFHVDSLGNECFIATTEKSGILVLDAESSVIDSFEPDSSCDGQSGYDTMMAIDDKGGILYYFVKNDESLIFKLDINDIKTIKVLKRGVLDKSKIYLFSRIDYLYHWQIYLIGNAIHIFEDKKIRHFTINCDTFKITIINESIYAECMKNFYNDGNLDLSHLNINDEIDFRDPCNMFELATIIDIKRKDDINCGILVRLNNFKSELGLKLYQQWIYFDNKKSNIVCDCMSKSESGSKRCKNVNHVIATPNTQSFVAHTESQVISVERKHLLLLFMSTRIFYKFDATYFSMITWGYIRENYEKLKSNTNDDRMNRWNRWMPTDLKNLIFKYYYSEWNVVENVKIPFAMKNYFDVYSYSYILSENEKFIYFIRDAQYVVWRYDIDNMVFCKIAVANHIGAMLQHEEKYTVECNSVRCFYSSKTQKFHVFEGNNLNTARRYTFSKQEFYDYQQEY